MLLETFLNTNFSRRYGLDVTTGEVKYEYLPSEFRVELYRLITASIEEKNEDDGFLHEYRWYRDLCVSINKQPDLTCYTSDDVYEMYRHELLIDLLCRAKWHEVLSMIEEMTNHSLLACKTINKLFEVHRIGYRVKKSDEGLFKVEVEYDGVVSHVAETTEALNNYPEIRQLLSDAQRYLVSPTSVSPSTAASSAMKALEAFVKHWFHKKSSEREPATLGDAIKQMKLRDGSMGDLNFLNAMDSFYIWRNRTSNVGHGGITSNVTPNDALLVLDHATSFINYLYRLDKAQP